MAETTYCARHPKTETNLRCGKCDTLICPQCLVHVPVGVRCPECAKTRRLPTFEVSGLHLARAVAASLALGIVGGLAFAFFFLLIVVPLQLYLIVFVGIGFLVGEGTSRSVNRKRGRNLKFVAAGGVLAAIIIVIVFGIVGIFFSTGLLGLLALGAAFYFAVKPF